MDKSKYTLFPALRYTGEMYLLLWHTHNEQNQLFIARTIDKLIRMFEIATKKNKTEFPEAKELWKASIVLPSTDIRNRYAEEAYNADVREFKQNISFEIKEYVRRNNELPIGVNRCSVDLPDDEEHYDCVSCENGFMLSKSWEQLMENHWDEYTNKPFSRQPFDGEVSTANETLYTCQLNSGHHCSGIILQSLDEANLFSHKILFFFHGKQLEMPKSINKITDEYEKREEIKKVAGRKAYEERYLQRIREQDERVLRLFR